LASSGEQNENTLHVAVFKVFYLLNDTHFTPIRDLQWNLRTAEKEEIRCGISAGEMVESREPAPTDSERLFWHHRGTLATLRKKPGPYESSERALLKDYYLNFNHCFRALMEASTGQSRLLCGQWPSDNLNLGVPEGLTAGKD